MRLLLRCMAIILALSGCVAAQDQTAVAQDQTSVAQDQTSVAGEHSGISPEDLNFAQVRYVRATGSADGSWRFDVSVEHNDEGWDHYADLWQVVDPASDEIIAERILAHPHDNEQPFTRSQSGVIIPDGVTSVLVRARCTVHGFGGSALLVDLTVAAGDAYQVDAPESDS